MKKRIYFTLKSTICKDCTIRSVGCHGKCESYIKECEERNKLKQIEHRTKVNYRHTTFEKKQGSRVVGRNEAYELES